MNAQEPAPDLGLPDPGPGATVGAYDRANANLRHAVPLEEVRRGIPREDPRDAIPPIYQPRYVSADEATLKDGDRVLGVAIGDEARAFPLSVLDRHEIVNDVIGGVPVAVAYCPLCRTGSAFDRRIGSKTFTFGVSGYLYQSDLVMWDHETESFWSQVEGQAIVGPMTGRPLTWLPCENTTWAAWKNAHLKTLVLRGPLPAAAYAMKPYRGYEDRNDTMFPVKRRDQRYHAKTWVWGIRYRGVTMAFPEPELKNAPAQFTVRFGEEDLTLRWDAANRNLTTTNANHEPVPVLGAFWFAWYTFHPDGLVFTADRFDQANTPKPLAQLSDPDSQDF